MVFVSACPGINLTEIRNSTTDLIDKLREHNGGEDPVADAKALVALMFEMTNVNVRSRDTRERT